MSVTSARSEGRLAVIRDGVDLPEDQARALWRAYSEHLERNHEDIDGFARSHGFVAVRTEHRRGRAVLYVSSVASLPPPPPRQSRPSRAPAKVREAATPPPKVAGRRR
jgi:hypothetical protein